MKRSIRLAAFAASALTLLCAPLAALAGPSQPPGINLPAGDLGGTNGVPSVLKVHGVAYPATPSTNTVPVVTGSNQTTYEAVPNAALANASVTIAGHVIALGASQTLACADLSNAGSLCPLSSINNANWSGTALSVSNGGVGGSSLAAHGVLIGAGTAPAVVSSTGSSGQVLTSNGASADPTFQALAVNNANWSGTALSVPNGGIGATSLTSHGVVLGEGTSNLSATSAGTSGQCLTSNGASADPTFQACSGGGGGATPPTFGTVTITQPATAATLTIANNKTFTVNNTVTLAGTDSTTMTLPSTSATLARTDAAQTFAGLQTFGGGLTVSSGQTNLSGVVINSGQAIVFNGFGKIGGIANGVQLQDASGATAFYIKNGGVVWMGGVPTADPHLAGQIWSSSGVLNVSAG